MPGEVPMTEAEWLACENPFPMIGHLRQGVGLWRFLLCDWTTELLTDRKLRLFACACVRQIWDLLPNEDARAEVGLAERYADGQASGRELQNAGRWFSMRFERQGPRAAAAALAGRNVTDCNMCAGLDKLLRDAVFAQ